MHGSLRFSPARAALACAVLGLFLLGCPTPPAGIDSGSSDVDAGCAGLIGCECNGGTCTTGECLSGACVDCRRGEAACTCRANNTCNAGLRCATGTCETCPAGESGCACGTGDVCNTGLSCTNGTCVADTCVAGTANCPCRTGASACDGTMYCDSTSLCRACSNDIVGCACAAGVCAGSTVCDSATQVCRNPRTCAQLAASNTCLPNQACTEATNGADATCTAMACQPEFKWNGTACVACVSAGCTNEPSCTDLDGGLGTTCATLNRVCVQTGASSACGTCVTGFVLNPGTNICVRVPSCGSTYCPFDQYCDRTSGTPTCAAIPCPAGQAQGSTNNTCTACMPNPNCSGPGFSGRTWPRKTATDVCLCETLDDYFIIGGGSVVATRCDLDGDGWVREEAGDPSVQADPATFANQRCTIKSVNRARLWDEYGISVDVLSCTEGLVKASLALNDGGTPNGGLGLFSDGGVMPFADGGTGCSAFLPMRLLETARNDIPGNPTGSTKAPVYGVTGRLLEAAELNSLTKACASISGDYNDNKLDDIAEVQGAVAPSPTRPTPAVDRARLESFAYFVELESAWTEGPVLNIRERSRCDAAFALHYAVDAGSPPNDPYLLANDKPYWRACARNRDPDYAANNPRAGFDFAKYDCDQTTGSCVLVAPAHPTRIAPVDPKNTLFRDFGLCRMGGALPADGLWRGMNHHSQFKCVNVVGGSPVNVYDHAVIEFAPTNDKLTFNSCNAHACATPGDPSCSALQGTTGAQTRQPVIDCQAQATALSGAVGFAAVNYKPYRFGDQPLYSRSFYAGGCVNEDDAWWQFLCPSPEFSLDKSLADAQFGRYSCYKYGSNFLWAGPLVDGGTNASDRSTLRWGVDPTNSSVFGPRPPPDGGL